MPGSGVRVPHNPLNNLGGRQDCAYSTQKLCQVIDFSRQMLKPFISPFKSNPVLLNRIYDEK
jgi:hypothetical protein